MVRSRAVQVAIGIDWEGRRQVLEGGVGQPGERDDLEGVFTRAQGTGLHGVQLVVSDDHAGLNRAFGQVLSEACWQRC